LFRAGILNESLAKPINLRYASVNFSVSPSVSSNVDILVIVKSARNNFRKRDIIRQTWGNPQYLKENVSKTQNVSTRLFFICGESDSKTEKDVDIYLAEESDLQKDLIIGIFNDSYFNNTYKSLVAFKWTLTEFKGEFQYLALFDDDIYVNMVNLGSFLKGLNYKKVLKTTSYYSGYPYFQITSKEDEDDTLAVADISNGLFIGTVYSKSTPSRDSSTSI